MAAQTISLVVGELKTLKPGPIERVAVGDAGLMSTSLLKNGQLLVFGEKEGVSTLHIWLIDGKEKVYTVKIEPSDYALARGTRSLATKVAEVREMTKDIPGLEVKSVGDRIVMTGTYDMEFQTLLAGIIEAYPESLDLTLSSKSAEIQELFRDVPGAVTRVVGENIVLTGEIHLSYTPMVETVQGRYPELMDLTRKSVLRLPNEKMVLMNVKITEFNRNQLDRLGITWGDGESAGSFAGPGGAYAAEVSDRNSVSVLQGVNAPAAITGGPADARNAFGYFGIATEVASRINLAVGSGDAIILAEPRLVARSGGEATFLAGGEVPIEIVTPTSAAIEFKQFGIQLSIKPEIDVSDNILANVETEISQVDRSVSVGNTPGFLTRRTTADVSLQAGETLVLSGLVDQDISKNTSGLKYLSDIPILGALFRSKEFNQAITELVIFVTPTISYAGARENLDAIERQKQMVQEFVEAVNESSLQIVE
ncbi:MAG: hypothetical protein HKO62_00340 [Gammaproteobacteria bacterium]|nr:hypothetical protein [Gammaproteobacteria bacterium]